LLLDGLVRLFLISEVRYWLCCSGLCSLLFGMVRVRLLSGIGVLVLCSIASRCLCIWWLVLCYVWLWWGGLVYGGDPARCQV